MIPLRALTSLSVAALAVGGASLRSPAAALVPGTTLRSLPSPAPQTPFPGTATTPLPAASGSPAPEPLPSPTATPPPAPASSPAATATPAASATPVAFTYRFVPRQPDHVLPNVPQIFAVYLNSSTLVSQGPIDIKVSTDEGTVKVMSKSGGREGIIPMLAPGDFEAYSKLPKIPFIASGMTVQLVFTAVSADGHRTSVSVPVRLK